VRDGVVTLTGWVDSYLKKWAAEEAAHRVRGVKAVNDVEVRLPGSAERRSRITAIERKENIDQAPIQSAEAIQSGENTAQRITEVEEVRSPSKVPSSPVPRRKKRSTPPGPRREPRR